MTVKTRPSSIVKDIALKKAFSVAQENVNSLVIGADTIVVCKGKILGKPKNPKEALKYLKLLNGSWQSIYTGVCVVWYDKRKILSGYEKSMCKAYKLSNGELKKYSSKHLDKAGAYAIQDTDDPFIEKIIGPKDNVMGFPMGLVKKLIRQSGFEFRRTK
jgi:nucleoside triphosphate pyrophosphatase